VAGALVAHGLGSVYIGSLVVGCLLCGAIAVRRLEPQLAPEVNGVRGRTGDLDPQELSSTATKTLSSPTD
jgi:hypothetical protein